MVVKLAGWLMYFPALSNCVSMFQNLMGCSRTTSLTLEDLVFPVAFVFNLEEMSIMLNLDNSVAWSAFEAPLSRLFILEIDSVAYIE